MNIQDRIKQSLEKVTDVELPSLAIKGEDTPYIIRIKPLSAGNMIKAQKLGGDDTAARMAYIIKYSAVDEKDEPLFTDADIDMLKSMTFENLTTLNNAAVYPGN